MTKDKAMKMALEALEELTDTEQTHAALERGDAAITALQEALAQPDYRAVKTYHEGEPVYVAQQEQNLNCKSTQARLATAWGYVKAQPEQESFEYWNAVEGWVKIDEVREHFDSVGCGTIYKTAGEDRTPLYTTPPQRKPLTDEQLDKAGMKLAECMDYPWEHMPEEGKRKMCDHAKAIIEAAHGIKE